MIAIALFLAIVSAAIDLKSVTAQADPKLELDVSNTAFCRSDSAVYILSHSKLFAVVILVSEELIRLEETENERVKFKCNQDLLIEIMPDKSERVFKKSS